MFKLESLGIKPCTKETFDEQQIEKFRNGIEYKEGKYHVELPWISDKVKLLPSNHEIALHVMHRVHDQLSKKQLTAKYSKVFQKQLEEEIIQEIHVKPSDYHK